MQRHRGRGLSSSMVMGIVVGCGGGLGFGGAAVYFLLRSPAPPPPPPPRPVPSPRPPPRTPSPPVLDAEIPAATPRPSAEEEQGGRAATGGVVASGENAREYFSGLDPASDVLRQHHIGDKDPIPVVFQYSESSLLPELPDKAGVAAFDAAARGWAESAEPGDYPEPLTSGRAEGASICGTLSRFGGSHDSKSPTGWVLCEGALSETRRKPSRNPPTRTRTYTGDCRTGPGGTCAPRPLGPPPELESHWAGVGGEGGCVVYSFGVGEEDSFEQHLAYDTTCEVHAFDPIPAVRQWVQARDAVFPLLEKGRSGDVDRGMMKILEAQQGKRPQGSWRTPLNGGYYVNMAAANSRANQVKFHPWGLAREDKEERVSNSWSRGESQLAQFKALRGIMEQLGHQRVDVVKLDIEGYEWGVLDQVLDPAVGVRQVLLEMHFGGAGQWVSALRALHLAGFRPFHAERLRYHGRGCKKGRTDVKCRGALQEVAFARRWT
eukprot:Hpha_TRINITY_DN52_c0_g1::TRINITY_DN52_c0_g1_i1::g.110027::m.110027